MKKGILILVLIAIVFSGCAIKRYTPSTTSSATVSVYKDTEVSGFLHVKNDAKNVKSFSADSVVKGKEYTLRAIVKRKKEKVDTGKSKTEYYLRQNGQSCYVNYNRDVHGRRVCTPKYVRDKRTVSIYKTYWRLENVQHKLISIKNKQKNKKIKIDIYKNDRFVKTTNSIYTSNDEFFVSSPSKNLKNFLIEKYFSTNDIKTLGKNSFIINTYKAMPSFNKKRVSSNFGEQYNQKLKNRFYRYISDEDNFLKGNYYQVSRDINKPVKYTYPQTLYWQSIELGDIGSKFIKKAKLEYKDIDIEVVDSLSEIPIDDVKIYITNLDDDIFSSSYTNQIIHRKIENNFLRDKIYKDIEYMTKSKGDGIYMGNQSFRVIDKDIKFNIKTIHPEYIALNSSVFLSKNRKKIVIRLEKIGLVTREANKNHKGKISTY